MSLVFLLLFFFFQFVGLYSLYCFCTRTILTIRIASEGGSVVLNPLTLLELQYRFGDTPVKFQVVCPKLSPERDCSPQRVKGKNCSQPRYGDKSVKIQVVCPQHGTTPVLKGFNRPPKSDASFKDRRLYLICSPAIVYNRSCGPSIQG